MFEGKRFYPWQMMSTFRRGTSCSYMYGTFFAWLVLLPCICFWVSSFVLFDVSGKFLLVISGNGLFAISLCNFGVWVICSRSMILLSVLILIPGSTEVKFDMGFPTYFLCFFCFWSVIYSWFGCVCLLYTTSTIRLS